MADNLTHDEERLLQLLHDGELDALGDDAARALGDGETGRGFLDALDEIGDTVRASERAWWAAAESDVPAAEAITAEVWDAPAWDDLPIEALAPMIERFHDGEATGEEAEVVLGLVETREDVMAYLDGLDELRRSMKVSVDEVAAPVSFDGFFAGVMAGLAEELPAEGESLGRVIGFPGGHVADEEDAGEAAFHADEHQVMLYRVFDDEASEEEVAQIESWRATDDEVASMLDVLGELNLAVNAGIEIAQERADLSSIWSGVQEGIAALDDAEHGKVVSLSARRAVSQPAAPAQPAEHVEVQQVARQPWWVANRQSIIAAAAALLAVLAANVMSNTFMKPGVPTVVEKKTVVIVDSVEHSSSSSVLVSSPVKRQAQPRPANQQPTISSATDEGDEPTVIWLIDEESAKQKTKTRKSRKNTSGAKPNRTDKTPATNKTGKRPI